jgi:hypothetical protein
MRAKSSAPLVALPLSEISAAYVARFAALSSRRGSAQLDRAARRA